MPVPGEVAIVGAGVTPFGVLHEKSYLDLISDSASAAVADAGVTLDRVEAAWLGTAEPLTAGLVGDSGAAVAQAIDFGEGRRQLVGRRLRGARPVRAQALDDRVEAAAGHEPGG